MTESPLRIAVVGAAHCGETLARSASEVGRGLGAAGAVLLTGGRGGVMAASSQGASEAGGRVVGVLPGRDADDTAPNPHVELTLFTGMGQARNLVLTLSADAVVAIGGGWGTLSEIALALKHRRPVVCLNSWTLQLPDGTVDALLMMASTPDDAVRMALEAARTRRISS